MVGQPVERGLETLDKFVSYSENVFINGVFGKDIGPFAAITGPAVACIGQFVQVVLIGDPATGVEVPFFIAR